MPYASPVATEQTSYRLEMIHTATGIKIGITVMFDSVVSSTEVQRDSLFQALLDQMSLIPNSTVANAKKNGGYTQVVTETP